MKKHLWLRWSIVVILLSFCMVLTAIQGKEPVTLKIWHSQSGQKGTAFEDILQEYAKANNLKLDIVAVGGYDDLVAKVMTGIASNNLPDIVALGQRHGIPQVADSGKLVPIQNFFKLKGLGLDIKDIPPAMLKRYTHKGKIWEVPHSVSVSVMHYNADMFRAAGLNPDKPPVTWEELIAAAQKLTKRNGNTVTQWGFNMNNDIAWQTYAFIFQGGGKLFDKKMNPTIDTAGSLKAFQLISDLIHKYKVMPANQHKDAKNDFVQGRLAIFYRSIAGLSSSEKTIGKKFDYRVAPLAGGPKGLSVPMGGQGLGICRSNPAQEREAWKMVRWLISPEQTARWSMATGYIPVRKSALELPVMKEYLENNPRVSAAYQELNHINMERLTYYDGPMWAEVEKLVGEIENNPKANIKQLLHNLSANIKNFDK